eukprot:7692469-Pyramimonas_sp.AAC.1
MPIQQTKPRSCPTPEGSSRHGGVAVLSDFPGLQTCSATSLQARQLYEQSRYVRTAVPVSRG